MLVLGLKGLIGAGKTTVARHLIEHHGFVRGRFAGGLKEMLRTLLEYRGCPAVLIERIVDGDLKETPTAWLNGRSAREAMESLGDGWGRGLHADFWIDCEHDHLLGKRPSRVLFEDCRYSNEAVAIRGWGGRVWEVYQPGKEPLDFPTERNQAAVVADDRVINRLGELDRTYAQVDELLARLMLPLDETTTDERARVLASSLPEMQQQGRR